MFCSKCGKEIADDAQFCQYCGNKIENKEETKEEKEIDLSINEPNYDGTKTSSLVGILGVMVFLSLIFIIIGSTVTNAPENVTTTNNTTSNSSSCPSVADMEDAISKYKSVNIIQKFNSELNSVYIPTYARNNMNIDDLRVLGYLTACYSAYKKNNGSIWVNIYNYNTGKKIAEYSDSWGFKMKE